ncbi:MAG: hypothetical protein ACOY0T_28985 [Myxococcota bacterium]
MKNTTPDGKTFQELIEAALEGQAAAAASQGTPNSGCIVGEVLDTHNPHLPGRVFVRWLDAEQKKVELWVQAERHLKLRKGDRVLLTLPTGFQQWIVTGALGRDLSPAAVPEAAEDTPELRLEPGQAVRIVSHDGTQLITVRQGVDGPELQLGTGNVELKAARTLRLTADTIELRAQHGGVDLRTDGDAVLRARTIRLN